MFQLELNAARTRQYSTAGLTFGNRCFDENIYRAVTETDVNYSLPHGGQETRADVKLKHLLSSRLVFPYLFCL